MGLIDTDKLESHECDAKRSGATAKKAVSGRGQVGVVSGRGQAAESVAGTGVNGDPPQKPQERTATAIENPASHRTHALAAASVVAGSNG